MLLLRQSTAATVKIGPFVDDTDGKTAETSLTIGQADVRLSKNGGDYAQKNDANACTHDELGEYDCALDATDTGTLGRLKLSVQESGALPVWHEYQVLTQDAYDALMHATGGKVRANAVEISGDSAAADNLEADYDGTGHARANSTIGTVTAVTGAVKVGEIQQAALADLFNTDSGTDYAGAVAGSPVKEIADNAAASVGESDKLDIADKVWDEAQSGHTSAGTFGEYLDAKISGVGSQTGSGALDVTITCKDAGGAPLDGAAVWVSTDAGGTNVVAGTKYTDAMGEVAFKLDAGTYWIHRQLSGYEFTPNPKQETVAAT